MTTVYPKSGYSQLLAWQGVLALPHVFLAPPLQVCADVLVAQPSGHQLQESQEAAVGGLQLPLPQAVPDVLPEQPMRTEQSTCKQVIVCLPRDAVWSLCGGPLLPHVASPSYGKLVLLSVVTVCWLCLADLADCLGGADAGLPQLSVKAGWR